MSDSEEVIFSTEVQARIALGAVETMSLLLSQEDYDKWCDICKKLEEIYFGDDDE